jgi:small subunit ribosomal protein S16
MLRIRLSRVGRKHTPIYRILVAQHTAPIKGKFIEILGLYDNSRLPKRLKLDMERYNHWVSKGAQPSETVANLVSKNITAGEKQVDKEFTKKRLPKKKASKVADKAVEEKPAEVTA